MHPLVLHSTPRTPTRFTSSPRPAFRLIFVLENAGLAGLPQDDEFVLALIAEAAPHARAMAGRLDRDYAFSDEI